MAALDTSGFFAGCQAAVLGAVGGNSENRFGSSRLRWRLALGVPLATIKEVIQMPTEHSYPVLPDKFGEVVSRYPECSYGAVRVILVLKDGTCIRDVILAGNAICKIGQKLIKSSPDLDFSVSDVIEVKQG